ncbi:1,2-phenylacetyl-CoA epoxidase subunit PaaE [Variovorax robiniae]|uniref:1,2-phenylacetyl-CoA epoxidase subunit PaaE n=1 Tax=Variovorax robiniae TaxID=1836199 RepID=A0ABU8X7L8_9BURK
MAAPQFHSLQVSHVEQATRDAVAVTFAVPEHLDDTFSYVQGQYLTLRTLLDGEELRRSYSICSAVQDRRLRVAIKRVSGGAFSNWAAENLRPGTAIEVMPPQGQFHMALQPDAQRHVVAFASGSGITPVLSIIKTTLLAEPNTSVTLVYGNRSSSGVMFKEELEDLKDTYLGRFNLVWIMSRESQDIPLFNGRIDHEKCSQLLTHWIDPAGIDAAFICGPEDMMLATSQALQDHGVDKSRIKVELFGTAPKDGKLRVTRAPAEGSDQCEVEVVVDGTRRSFFMRKNTDNLVDAGIKAGLEMPYSCKGGVCSTCRAKVLHGEVDMDINFALEDYEVARGFVLCCQSYPVTDKLVIDFDQEHAHN